ncbi:MAG: phenylalanine--tRNA ligase subunit beta, partial [Bacteroidales bacterium]|nr:phenylalanine--tRNA ligase subunit beta [Bacteroidales bacterium]
FNEEKHLCIFTTGANFKETWQKKEEETNFFDLKNVLMNIFKKLRINPSQYSLEETSVEYMQGLQYVNRDSKKTILSFGKINQKIRKEFDIKQDIYFADFNWDLVVKALQNAKEIKYEEISKFPEVRRDLALVIDDSVSFAEIENLAYQTEKKFLKKNITLFDVYKGEKLPQGKKQYALSFTLQDNEKTLNDKQIESIMNKLLKSFEDKLGAKLR